MNKIGLSRLAVTTELVKKNDFLAALHFLLEENSLEEVMLKLESELQKKLPPIFKVFKSIEDLLIVRSWRKLPQEFVSLANDATFESIARCTKRQISKIQIQNQIAVPVNTYGRQFPLESNFYVVEFCYNSEKFPFAATATKIRK